MGTKYHITLLLLLLLLLCFFLFLFRRVLMGIKDPQHITLLLVL